MTLLEVFAPVLHSGFLDQSSVLDGTLSHTSNLAPITLLEIFILGSHNLHNDPDGEMIQWEKS